MRDDDEKQRNEGNRNGNKQAQNKTIFHMQKSVFDFNESEKKKTINKK